VRSSAKGDDEQRALVWRGDRAGVHGAAPRGVGLRGSLRKAIMHAIDRRFMTAQHGFLAGRRIGTCRTACRDSRMSGTVRHFLGPDVGCYSYSVQAGLTLVSICKR